MHKLEHTSLPIIRSFNNSFAKMAGDRVNRGAGYGLEIPCTYRFYGPMTSLIEGKKLCLHASELL